MANKNVTEVTVKIDGQEWKDALEKAYDKASKKAKIDGFRPGKAPKEVFMKKYGVESLFMDAGDLVLESAYKKAFEGKDSLELVAQPDIALKSVDENSVEFVFTLTTKPEVKLGKYKGLKVKKEEIKVTKEYELLMILIENKDEVVTRDELLERIWGYDTETNVTDVYIRHLRSKLNNENKEEYIQTVRSIGYIMRS